MTPTEQLYRLPEAVQAELWQLTRSVMGMSRDERITALEAVNGVCEAFLFAGRAQHVPTIQMFNALAQVVREIDVEGFPRTEEN